MKKILPMLRQFGIFSIVIIIAILSLFGQKTLPNLSIPYGFYTATTNNAGIAFYQKQPHASYMISPYNDYLVINGERIAFVPQNTTIQSSQETFPFHLLRQIASYIGLAQLTYHITSPLDVSYTGTIQNNALTIERIVHLPTNITRPTAIASTLLYSRDDVIIDDVGNLLTESTDDDIDTIGQITGKKIIIPTNTQGRKRQSNANTLYIINPRTSGVIKVYSPQSEFISVDNEHKLIEMDDFNPTIQERKITSQTIIATEKRSL